jgi:hypothetical protein
LEGKNFFLVVSQTLKGNIATAIAAKTDQGHIVYQGRISRGYIALEQILRRALVGGHLIPSHVSDKTASR